MGDQSQIEWTDATWNPVTGCTRVSQGCKHCYMERVVPRQGLDPWTVTVHALRLFQPLNWKKPRRIFVNSLSDLFHEDVPDGFIDRVFAVMSLTPNHTYQVLTKRQKRMEAWFSRPELYRRLNQTLRTFPGCAGLAMVPTQAHGMVANTWPLPNVWLGVSIEDQPTADERIPILLQTPAAVRFVSCEPLLGPIDLRRVHGEFVEIDSLTGDHGVLRPLAGRSDRRLDWVIVGGESGPKARPMHPDWARSIRDQCQPAEVPFFFKQWGEWKPEPHDDSYYLKDVALFNYEENGDSPIYYRDLEPDRQATWDQEELPGDERMFRVGKKNAGRLLDGQEHSAFPQHTGAIAP